MKWSLVPILVPVTVLGAGLGKSTYAMSHPFGWKSFMETYFPTAENVIQANNTDTCVEWAKLCVDDGQMTACSGPQGNFQLHSVGAYKRDSGSKSMEELETAFTQSMGAMDKFDPFFDFNVGLVTSDLDAYVSAFDKGKVPYFASTFTDPGSSKEYKSVLVQTPGSLAEGSKSLLSIEILSQTSSLLALRAAKGGLHHHTLPRASPDALASAEARLTAAPRKLGSNGMPVLTMSHQSFASSDLDRDVKYFEGVLQGSKVYEGSENGEKVYAGKMISTDVAEVIYRKSSATTQGPTSVAQWEAYQKALHAKCFVSADNEGFDRLGDNHIGHAIGQVAYLDDYIKAQKKAGLPYRFYGGPGGRAPPYFLYIYGANGWGTQLVSSCKDASLCPSTVQFYDMCTQGITGDCSHDQLSNHSLIV